MRGGLSYPLLQAAICLWTSLGRDLQAQQLLGVGRGGHTKASQLSQVAALRLGQGAVEAAPGCSPVLEVGVGCATRPALIAPAVVVS